MSDNEHDATKTSNNEHDATKTSNKTSITSASMVTLKPKEIGLDDDKLELFGDSQFLPLLKGMMKGDYRENSSSLTLHLCKNFSISDKKFLLNKNACISFCATEVANVLGIRSTGDHMQKKNTKFPPWVLDLKELHSKGETKKEKKTKGDKTKINKTGKTKREFSTARLKQVLMNFPVEDLASKEYYKKLLLFYILDQFLLPSSDKFFVRSKMFGHVDNLDNFEKINWAKSTLDLIHTAASNIASGKPNFHACTPVFEAMLFARIKKLQPGESDCYVNSMPIVFKFKNKRCTEEAWIDQLKDLTQSDVADCPHCVTQEVVDTDDVVGEGVDVGRENASTDDADAGREDANTNDFDPSIRSPLLLCSAEEHAGGVVEERVRPAVTNFSRCSRPRKSKEHFASTHATRQEDESTHQVPQSSRVESPSGYLKQVETSLRHKEIEKGGNGVDEENTEENLLRNYRALEEMMEEEVGEEEVTLAEKPADEDNEAHQVPEGSQRESPSRYLKQMKPTLRCREIEKGGKCVAEENDDENFLTDKEVSLADKPISMDPYEVVAARVVSLKRPIEENLGDGIAVQLPEMMGEIGEKEVLLLEKSIPKVRSRTSSLGLTNFVNMVVGEDDEVDSERCAMDIVKAESMSILRKIQDRHGDIVKNCTASRMLRSEYLQTICDIISQLEGKNLSQIKEDFLLHKIAYVDLIKNKEVDIDWLRNFLVDMLEAKKHLGENFGKLKKKKEITKMLIEEAECKLMECQEQKRELSAKLREVSDLLRSKCDEEIVCKEALANAKDESTKIAQSIKCVISEAKRFLDCSPVDDLFS